MAKYHGKNSNYFFWQFLKFMDFLAAGNCTGGRWDGDC